MDNRTWATRRSMKPEIRGRFLNLRSSKRRRTTDSTREKSTATRPLIPVCTTKSLGQKQSAKGFLAQRTRDRLPTSWLVRRRLVVTFGHRRVMARSLAYWKGANLLTYLQREQEGEVDTPEVAALKEDPTMPVSPPLPLGSTYLLQSSHSAQWSTCFQYRIGWTPADIWAGKATWKRAKQGC